MHIQTEAFTPAFRRKEMENVYVVHSLKKIY
jgi:hypothetical protein